MRTDQDTVLLLSGPEVGSTGAADHGMIAPVQTTTIADDRAKAVEQGDRKVPRWVHRVAVALVVAACTAALYFSGWGMWHFIEHKLGVKGWHLILPMFALFDLAGIASAWLARIRRIEDGKSGVAGLLVWVFAVLSGLMSATDATTWGGHAIRFAAPLVAAMMFELLISGERRAVVGKDNSTLAKIARRIKSRLGLLDTLEQDDQEAARAAVAGRVAVLAYKVHSLPPETKNSGAYRRAVRKYHRKLRAATERFGFGGDAAMVAAVRVHLATLYRSLTDTSEHAVADVNPWQSGARQRNEVDAAVADALREAREQHVERMESLHIELESVRSAADERNAEMEQLRVHLHQLGEQVAGATAATEAERGRVRQLQAELDAAHAELDAGHNELAQAQVLIDELRTAPSPVAERTTELEPRPPRPRGSKEAGVAALIQALRAGEEIDKRAFAEKYGTSSRTVNRWVEEAQLLVADGDDRDRPALSVVGRR